MGHSTATVEISVEAARHACSEVLKDKYHFRRPTEASSILRAGVAYWYDTEANRDDHSRAGDGHMVKPMTLAQAHTFVNADENFNLVRDRSVVVPIASDVSVTRATKKLKVAVADLNMTSYSHLHDHLRKTVPGYTSHRVLEQPRRLKPVAVTKPGAARTAYLLLEGNRTLSTHNTLAEARQAGIEHVEANGLHELGQLRVEARQMKDGSAALITFEHPYAKSASYQVEVTVETVKPNPKLTSYLVAFDYHH